MNGWTQVWAGVGQIIGLLLAALVFLWIPEWKERKAKARKDGQDI